MSLTRDQYQLEVSFITDESRALAKTIQDTKELPRELRKAVKEGEGVADVMKKIEAAGKQAEKIDLGKVTPAQLIARARQLKQILSQLPESAPQVEGLTAEYKALNDRLAETRKRTRGVAQAQEELKDEKKGGILNFLKSGTARFLSFTLAAAGALRVLLRLGSATSAAQKLEKTLENALGSKSEAQKAIRGIIGLADELKLPSGPLIESYTKLVNRGIRPTIGELRQLVDLAASQGKSLDQLAEAALDAATGEFERLKEFGIRAKSQGDQVQLSFKGQTIEVAKTQDAILKTILGFSELQGIQGAAAASTDNLGDKYGKLTALIDRFLANLGSGGIGGAMGAAIDAASGLVKKLVDLTDTQESVTVAVRATQSAFNVEIETLKRGNLSTDVRAQLVKQLNDRYGEYLPNLLKEESTLGEIYRAQELANRAFENRIVLLAAEERLVSVANRRLEAKAEELGLETAITRARLRTLDVEERQAKNQNTQNFAGVGIAKNLAGQASANDLLAKAIERKNANQAKQIELEKEFQNELLAANDLKIDVSSLLNPQVDGIVNGGSGPTSKDPLGDALKKLATSYDLAEELTEQARINNLITESDYQKRLLELQAEEYRLQLELFDRFNQSKSLAAEEARTELLRTQQQLKPSSRVAAPVATLDTPDQVTRGRVPAGIDALAQEEERALTRLQRLYNEGLAATDQFTLGKLEIRRSRLTEEIELLRSGNDAEIRLAREKADELKEVDQNIFEQKASLAERETELRESVNEAARDAGNAALDFTVGLLARDAEARKKNAGLIKTFEIGRALVAGISEIAQIRLAAAAQIAGLGPLGAALGPAILARSTLRQIGAGIQTSVAVGNIAAQKFARGGLPKFALAGGRPHTQGGTQLYGDDGTRLEVEKDELLAVVNKRSTGLLGALSSLNVAGGGVPFFAAGGIALNAPATVPQLSPGTLGQTGALSQDNAELLAELRELRVAFGRFPKSLKTSISLTEINEAQDDLDTIRAASEV